MKIIGVTGKSGSGKTTFAELLAKKLKGKYIDIDKIGHQALFQKEILDELCNRFGREILDANGNLDRKKIGEIVFIKRNKMKELSDLTWEYMQKVLDGILLGEDSVIVLDWILLPHSKYWKMCDTKILVRSNDTKRKQKVLERDNISSEYFDKRDSASIDYSEIKFDFIFENDYSKQTIERMIKK